MILYDAYAVIAYLQSDAGSGLEVRRLFREAMDQGQPPGAITAVNAAEVIDHLVRIRGVAPDDAILDLAQLGMVSLPVDEGVGWRAGLLRAAHYHPRRCQVSMADCVAAATLLDDATIDALATADPDLLDLVDTEGGRSVALPASDGSRWSPRPAD